MWLDALLAYLHFTAVFLVFAFISVEIYLVRLRLDATTIRQLARVDLWYFGSAIATLVTGLLRAVAGAKGWEYYSGSWMFWAKIALFAAVALVSIAPARAFRRWKAGLERDLAYEVPGSERDRARGMLMLEVHLASIIPVFAVILARALDR